MSSLSSNTIPVDTPPATSSAPVSDPDQLQLQQDLKDILSEILEGQEGFYEYFHEKYDVELTEEEILAQEEDALHQQEYKDDLLETLHQIYAATVSQNGLLEENNRLLSDSVSMNGLEEIVSENTVSQNALLTTKLEDYSLTDSLLLIIFFFMLLILLVNTFLKRGR